MRVFICGILRRFAKFEAIRTSLAATTPEELATSSSPKLCRDLSLRLRYNLPAKAGLQRIHVEMCNNIAKREDNDQPEDAPLPPTLKIADAHCHPTDSLATLPNITSLTTSLICTMSTSFHDLGHVERLYLEHGSRVVPAFGFHPWHYHKLASTKVPVTPVQAAEDTLEPFVLEDAELATRLIQDQRDFEEWTTLLIGLLKKHPKAIVGEIGMDRAASLPNTNSKLKINANHQCKIFEEQLRIAGRLKRPVSCHCVRAHGHMIDMFKKFGKESPEEFPPAIFGPRIYVSFSTVINARSPKLADRIRAVPADRLLIESDYSTMNAIDAQMAEIVQVVSEATGWSVEETCRRTFENFLRFSHVDPYCTT
ncbi:hypothetical protein SeMB42_g06271 [Synchytrium endobioticum]|uniref:TatD DNase family protein n=1 Tax=Synchytrium endobioticum TaxID=286115 RepID=A0A507CE10_9FUNG|nr:hypothetical protein SeMB42_g06271 [Synchytrium endobioticum]